MTRPGSISNSAQPCKLDAEEWSLTAEAPWEGLPHLWLRKGHGSVEGETLHRKCSISQLGELLGPVDLAITARSVIAAPLTFHVQEKMPSPEALQSHLDGTVSHPPPDRNLG